MDTATVRGVITTCIVVLGVAVTPVVASAAIAGGGRNSISTASLTDSVTFILEGEITSLGSLGGPAPSGFQVGDRFRFQYSFNPTTADQDSDSRRGNYLGAVTSVDIAIEAYSGSGSAGDIYVGDGWNIYDDYYVFGTHGQNIPMGGDLVLDYFFIGLQDSTGTTFADDLLPLDPRQLDGLSYSRMVGFGFLEPNYGELEGRIDSLSSIDIDIDIEPGSDVNTVNIDQTNANIEVALLGSADLDVSDVDLSTLQFGATGTEAAPVHNLDKKGTRKTHLKDVNGDGFTDLITHYRAGDTGLEADDSVACLRASSLTGQSLQGCDSVQIKSNPAVGPPVSRPVGPPDGAPVGPPINPPAGPPMSPPVGPPMSPPVGPPMSPPAGPPASPPVGPPISPPAGPPVSPPVSRPVAPMFAGFVDGLGSLAGLIGTIVVAVGFMLLTANGAASSMTVGTNRPIRGHRHKTRFSRIALTLKGVPQQFPRRDLAGPSRASH